LEEKNITTVDWGKRGERRIASWKKVLSRGRGVLYFMGNAHQVVWCDRTGWGGEFT